MEGTETSGNAFFAAKVAESYLRIVQASEKADPANRAEPWESAVDGLLLSIRKRPSSCESALQRIIDDGSAKSIFLDRYVGWVRGSIRKASSIIQRDPARVKAELCRKPDLGYAIDILSSGRSECVLPYSALERYGAAKLREMGESHGLSLSTKVLYGSHVPAIVNDSAAWKAEERRADPLLAEMPTVLWKKIR